MGKEELASTPGAGQTQGQWLLPAACLLCAKHRCLRSTGVISRRQVGIYLTPPPFNCFLEPHPQPMEVPRLRSELQLPACATATAIWDPSRVCDLYHSSKQHWIPDPLSKARDPTRILMDASQIHFPWTTRELLISAFLKISALVCFFF